MDNTKLNSPITRRPSHLLLTLKELQLQTNQHLYTLAQKSRSRSIRSHTFSRMALLTVLRLNSWVCKLCLSASAAGTDSGNLSSEDVAELFGNTKGYKASDRNAVDEDDF